MNTISLEVRLLILGLSLIAAVLTLMPTKVWAESQSENVLVDGAETVIEKGDLVVVVSKLNSIISLTQEEIKDIYLGRSVKFPGTDIKAISLDLHDKTLRKRFYKAVANKSLRKVNAYWARYLFSGKGNPPEKIINSQQMIEKVNSSIEFIGYINAEFVTDDMKVIYRVKR